MLAQPFYWNPLMGRWYRLSASPEGLSMTLSAGTGGSHWTGSHFPTGGAFDTGARGLLALDDLEVAADGPSALRAAGQLTLQSQPLRLEHHYALDPEAPILRVTTRVINLGDAPVANLHLWIGAGDDWVGNSDTPQKDRGNLIGGVFARIVHREEAAAAILLSTLAEGVLLYSPAPGAGVIHDRCCSFSNSYLAHPATAFPEWTGDGSYALHLPVGDLQPGGSAEVIWFYAAAPRSELAAVVARVASERAP
jgi:hypothetical protein